MTLAQLNAAPAEEAAVALERCCGARAWVEAMLAARPYADREALHALAARTWDALPPAAWEEAFAHHPRIGDRDALRAKFRTTAAWAGREQQGAAEADEATLTALAEGNEAYTAKYGRTFIVCATGRSAEEMLAILRARLANAPDEELRAAAAQQLMITHLRLDKLLEEAS